MAPRLKESNMNGKTAKTIRKYAKCLRMNRLQVHEIKHKWHQMNNDEKFAERTMMKKLINIATQTV